MTSYQSEVFSVGSLITLYHEVVLLAESTSYISGTLPRAYRSSDSRPCTSGPGATYSHLESFIESGVPPLRLFLMLSMMPLKSLVPTENVLTVLLGNEVWYKFLM